MYDSSIVLKKITYPEENTDEYGNLVEPIVTVKPLYAEVLSIGYKEFYEAAAAGFKPEIKFKIADCKDYNGEQQLLYEGKLYDVIRTYTAPNNYELEIICTRGIE